MAYLTSRENASDGSAMVRQLVLLSGLLQLPDTAPANPFKIPELAATCVPTPHQMRTKVPGLASDEMRHAGFVAASLCRVRRAVSYSARLQVRPSDVLPRSAGGARAGDRVALAVRARDRVRLGLGRRTRLVRTPRTHAHPHAHPSAHASNCQSTRTCARAHPPTCTHTPCAPTHRRTHPPVVSANPPRTPCARTHLRH